MQHRTFGSLLIFTFALTMIPFNSFSMELKDLPVYFANLRVGKHFLEELVRSQLPLEIVDGFIVSEIIPCSSTNLGAIEFVGFASKNEQISSINFSQLSDTCGSDLAAFSSSLDDQTKNAYPLIIRIKLRWEPWRILMEGSESIGFNSEAQNAAAALSSASWVSTVSAKAETVSSGNTLRWLTAFYFQNNGATIVFVPESLPQEFIDQWPKSTQQNVSGMADSDLLTNPSSVRLTVPHAFLNMILPKLQGDLFSSGRKENKMNLKNLSVQADETKFVISGAGLDDAYSALLTFQGTNLTLSAIDISSVPEFCENHLAEKELCTARNEIRSKAADALEYSLLSELTNAPLKQFVSDMEFKFNSAARPFAFRFTASGFASTASRLVVHGSFLTLSPKSAGGWNARRIEAFMVREK